MKKGQGSRVKGQGKSKKHCEEIFCAGFGGQGIMFMGKLIIQVASAAGKHVTWMPSYGAEVRGGTAYSMAKISDHEIASPVVVNPTVLIAMNEPSLVKYGDKVIDGGLLIVNKTLISEAPKREGITVLNIPMTEIASKLGNTKCANMVAVGAFIKRSQTLSLRNVINALKEILSRDEKLFLLNKEALEKGYKL